MPKNLLLIFLWCLGAYIPSLKAEETNPHCLVFSGHSGQEYALDMALFNRITFGENSMIVTGPDNSSSRKELLYTAFHHLEFKKAKPSEVNELSISSTNLFYDRASDSIKLTTDSDKSCTVGIFNLDGILMMSAEISNGNALSIEKLPTGIYIAVAVGANLNQRIKFVK